MNTLARYAVMTAVTVGSVLAPAAAASRQGGPSHSVARVWNDELLDAIRVDFARPTVHARNLYHVSAAMWDAWAAYDPDANQVLHDEKLTAADVEAARREAISFATYRILVHRFIGSPGAAQSIASINSTMDQLTADLNFENDKTFTSTVGNSPAALGNRIAATVIQFGFTDNANELNGYENQFYDPVNEPLLPELPGNPTFVFQNRWQPLALQFFIDQGGNPVPFGYPEFLSAEWGQVSAFALAEDDLKINSRDGFDYWIYHDPGPPPFHAGLGDADYKHGFEQVAIWSSHLDPTDGVMWDISPASSGNSPLPNPSEGAAYYDFLNGGDWGTGYTSNPVTGEPYTPQIVPRGDYARVLAEFWADGPDSETPPGHWFTLMNYVTDQPSTVKKWAGVGPVLSDLEWDVRCYLTMGGAMHDVAVAIWGVKGWYDYPRPISALRYLADLGQCTDDTMPHFDVNGINLHDGLVELVTTASTAPGERHEHLAGEEGKIAVYAWRGPDYITNEETDVAGVGWILAENWWPYQRPTFVTPPFAGYVSGHSGFSRAAAEVLTLITDSPWFPGGLGEFECTANEFLVFEDGPSVTIKLQWASYFDAADQSALLRIWGGIHPPADDLPARTMGSLIGPEAYDRALLHFEGLIDCRADVANQDNIVNFDDLVTLLGYWGTCDPLCLLDLADGNHVVDFDDLSALLSVWGPCP